MSYVGKNIKRIRSVKKLSQADFASLFNLARPSVGAYEEGRSEPKIQTLLDIAQKFGLSVDVLLTKELTVNDLYKLDMVNEKFDQMHGGTGQSRRVVKTDSIGFVQSVKQVEYIVNYHNKDFLNALPPIDLPLTFKGEARAFEMYGEKWSTTRQEFIMVISYFVEKKKYR
jgi:transcriptional regulator with XRE-family HTH domain